MNLTQNHKEERIEYHTDVICHTLVICSTDKCRSSLDAQRERRGGDGGVTGTAPKCHTCGSMISMIVKDWNQTTVLTAECCLALIWCLMTILIDERALHH